jgi:hypothetical protein
MIDKIGKLWSKRKVRFYLVLTLVILVVFYLFYKFYQIMVNGPQKRDQLILSEEDLGRIIDAPSPKYLPRHDRINTMIPPDAYSEVPSESHLSLDPPLKREGSKGNRLVPFIDSGYQIYESPRRDSHSFLDRDLQTGLGFDHTHVQYKEISRQDLESATESNGLFQREGSKVDREVPFIEHLTMSEDELKQRFPDYDKASYSMTSSQNPSDILQPIPYKDKGLSIQIPDSLKGLDMRPYEQKHLDDLLDTENLYIYLMRQRLLDDMSNGNLVANDQKLAFYYGLFMSGLDDIKSAYAYYVSKIGTPGYQLDSKLTDKIQRYYLGSPNLFTQITGIYQEILKKESIRGSAGLTSADITGFKGRLLAFKIDTPQYLMNDSEDDAANKEDSFEVIQSFADDVNNFFHTLNDSIVPYYVYMFDLAIPGVPIPSEDQGAELSKSFTSDMTSIQTLYSDITLAYIYKSDIFSKILNNPKNTGASSTASTTKLAKYRQNILLLPNISPENVTLINQLFDSGKITEAQCEGFEQTVNQVIMLNKYFGSLYNLYLINPSKPDYAALKAILTGKSPFNLNPQQNGTIIKIADKSISDPQNIQYGFQNISTSVKIPLVTPLYGFTSDAAEVPPLNKSSVKAATASSSTPTPAQVGKAISTGTTQAANTVAQGTVQAANTVANGATQVGNAIASGTTQTANKVGKAISKVFKKI